MSQVSQSERAEGRRRSSATSSIAEDVTAGALRPDLSPLPEQESPSVPQVALSEFDMSFEDTTQLSGPSIPAPLLAPYMSGKDTLLKQVLGLREPGSSPASPEVNLPEDLLSQIGDGETIQIVLGETPKLPSENFLAPRAPTVFERDQDEIDFADGRTSIYPDDSVSVIFQRKMEENLPVPVPRMPSMAQQRATGMTLDSAARSQVNHVLEGYRQCDLTPELPGAFPSADSMTPDSGFRDSWQSAPETQLEADSGYEAVDKSKKLHSPPPAPKLAEVRPMNGFEDEEAASPGVAIIYRTQS
jgi:hypothetical protein